MILPAAITFAPLASVPSALCVSAFALAFALAFLSVIPAGNLRLPIIGAAA